jgi:hypothetical protein
MQEGISASFTLESMYLALFITCTRLSITILRDWSFTFTYTYATAEVTAFTYSYAESLSPFNAKVRMSETAWRRSITTYSWRVNDLCRPVCFMSAIAIKGSGKAGALHHWRNFPTLHIWQILLMYWCCIIGVDCRRLLLLKRQRT